jgi:hypothetical protein
MQNRDYEIVRYGSRFKAEVLELLKPLWGPDLETSSKYLDWKYQWNPYGREPYMYLALQEGHVVGSDSYFVSCWQAGEKRNRYYCMHGCDSVVHPDHRGQGLHKKIKAVAMKDLKKSGHEVEIVMAANEITTSHNIKAGGVSVAELSRLSWRPCRNGSKLRKLASKAAAVPFIYRQLRNRNREEGSPSIAFRPFRVLDENYARCGPFGRSKIILEAGPRPEAMALLVSRLDNDGLIKHVRDKEFYSWRYQNPLSVYRFLYLERGGLQGFMVVQLTARGRSDSGFIVDWEAENDEIFSELLEVLIRNGGFSCLEIWAAALKTGTARSLVKRGFSAEPPSDVKVFYPHLLILPLREPDCYRLESRNLLEIANWDLRPIFSDSY